MPNIIWGTVVDSMSILQSNRMSAEGRTVSMSKMRESMVTDIVNVDERYETLVEYILETSVVLWKSASGGSDAKASSYFSSEYLSVVWSFPETSS